MCVITMANKMFTNKQNCYMWITGLTAKFSKPVILGDQTVGLTPNNYEVNSKSHTFCELCNSRRQIFIQNLS